MSRAWIFIFVLQISCQTYGIELNRRRLSSASGKTQINDVDLNQISEDAPSPGIGSDIRQLQEVGQVAVQNVEPDKKRISGKHKSSGGKTVVRKRPTEKQKQGPKKSNSTELDLNSRFGIPVNKNRYNPKDPSTFITIYHNQTEQNATSKPVYGVEVPTKVPAFAVPTFYQPEVLRYDALRADWTLWSSWSECKQGRSTRVRGCYKMGGFECQGKSLEARDCTLYRVVPPAAASATNNNNNERPNAGTPRDLVAIGQYEYANGTIKEWNSRIQERWLEIADELQPEAKRRLTLDDTGGGLPISAPGTGLPVRSGLTSPTGALTFQLPGSGINPPSGPLLSPGGPGPLSNIDPGALANAGGPISPPGGSIDSPGGGTQVINLGQNQNVAALLQSLGINAPGLETPDRLMTQPEIKQVVADFLHGSRTAHPGVSVNNLHPHVLGKGQRHTPTTTTKAPAPVGYGHHKTARPVVPVRRPVPPTQIPSNNVDVKALIQILQGFVADQEGAIAAEQASRLQGPILPPSPNLLHPGTGLGQDPPTAHRIHVQPAPQPHETTVNPLSVQSVEAGAETGSLGGGDAFFEIVTFPTPPAPSSRGMPAVTPQPPTGYGYGYGQQGSQGGQGLGSPGFGGQALNQGGPGVGGQVFSQAGAAQTFSNFGPSGSISTFPGMENVGPPSAVPPSGPPAVPAVSGPIPDIQGASPGLATAGTQSGLHESYNIIGPPASGVLSPGIVDQPDRKFQIPKVGGTPASQEPVAPAPPDQSNAATNMQGGTVIKTIKVPEPPGVETGLPLKKTELPPVRSLNGGPVAPGYKSDPPGIPIFIQGVNYNYNRQPYAIPEEVITKQEASSGTKVLPLGPPGTLYGALQLLQNHGPHALSVVQHVVKSHLGSVEPPSFGPDTPGYSNKQPKSRTIVEKPAPAPPSGTPVFGASGYGANPYLPQPPAFGPDFFTHVVTPAPPPTLPPPSKHHHNGYGTHTSRRKRSARPVYFGTHVPVPTYGKLIPEHGFGSIHPNISAKATPFPLMQFLGKFKF